jgi:hypothetical protein
MTQSLKARCLSSGRAAREGKSGERKERERGEREQGGESYKSKGRLERCSRRSEGE